MIKTIAWEKWKNPYKVMQKKHAYNDGYESNTDDFDEDDEGDDQVGNVGNNLVFYTSLGPVPLTNENNPEKLFNFWVGFTNFDITEKVVKILNEAPGVELLTIYTRYRFRIGVGKLFVPKNVMNNIEASIRELFNAKQEPLAGINQHDTRPGDSARDERDSSS
jgi:hypothetical protein